MEAWIFVTFHWFEESLFRFNSSANDFRKLINVIVILVSGIIATVGYQIIPFKAYVIVASLSGLIVAFILTKLMKKKWLVGF